MDYYEEAVLFHLTSIKHMFVLPQPAIVERDEFGKVSWEAYPDFLAVNFNEPSIEVVEVTKAWKIDKVREKCKASYLQIVERNIREKILQRELTSFSLNWHFIVRSALVERVREELDKNGLGSNARVTCLEKILEEIAKQLP